MISVIVPVYNVEKYLERCVNSILAQTYRDFELLLIDDGSTDESGTLCDKFVLIDERIRVFHKENGGQSDARNLGLDNMRGEYICFVDSDDYIGPDCLKILLEMMQDEHADMTIVTLTNTVKPSTDMVQSLDQRSVFTPEEAFKEIVLCRKTGVSPCAKLYNKKLFANQRFPKGRLYEDLALIPYLVEKCSCIAYSTSIQYYYFQREGSTMHTISDRKIQDWCEGMERLYDYARKSFPKTLDCVITRYNEHGFATVVNNLLDSEEYVEKTRQFQQRHWDWWRRCLVNPYLRVTEKAKTAVFLIHPSLYRMVYRAFKFRIGLK